ncbi:putative FRE ferric reductase-like transmembrane component [Cryomyces antarcticus]
MLLPRDVPESSVHDFGYLGNLSSKANPFTHGLTGVDQKGNYLFVNILIWTFACICLFSLIYRFSKMFNAHIRHMFTMGRQDQQSCWSQNQTTIWANIKKHLLYAPLFRSRHNREFRISQAVNVGTLPSRFHTLLLLGYFSCNIAYCLVLNGSKENSAAVLAEFRGRTGVLAAFNLIPTVLFALRNNPLIPLLKVSYDTFNLFHRWTARIFVLEAFLHTLAWAINATQAGGFIQLQRSLNTSGSYQWGMVATVVYMFVLLQACSPLRHAFYETFLNLHRLLVLVGLIGVYLHLDKAGLPQVPYLQLVFTLWGLEGAWRVYRILYYNLSARHGITKITVEALPSEACRVTFDLVRPWSFRPGCHVHAYLPTIALWSSHPFSVAWAEPRAANAESLDIEMEKLPSHSTSSTLASTATGSKSAAAATSAFAAALDAAPEADRTSVSLIMRAQTGMTRTLYNRALAAPTGVFSTWGAIEGPYGGHESLASYGTLLLFAGGVGITHQISFVRSLVAAYDVGTVSTRKITLVWSVPTTECLEWVRPWMDEILKMPARRAVLRILLFVTKPRSRQEIVSGTGTVQMFPGRCNPHTILDKEVLERVGAMAVTVCGPGAFADAVRAAVRRRVGVGCVDFVEEAFTY